MSHGVEAQIENLQLLVASLAKRIEALESTPEKVRCDNMADLLTPGKATLPPIVKRERTMSDFMAFYGALLFIGRTERDAWDALYARYGWDPMEECVKAISKTLTRGHRVMFSMAVTWLTENYKIEGE